MMTSKKVRLCAVLIPSLTAAACGVQAPPDFGDGPGTDVDYGDVGLNSSALTDLSAQCTFATGAMALHLAADDIAVISKSSAGAIVVNGFACGAATASNIRTISVDEQSSGTQVLVLDYLGGPFASGRSAAPGVAVDLGGDAGDSLRIRGLSGNDNMVAGVNGIAINADGFVDITYIGALSVLVSLGPGNDAFSGAGNVATGAALTSSVTVYGGAGNDTLRGGAGDDALNGGDGNDVFNAGDLADGSDTLRGGDGIDTASYAARTASVTVTIDDVADDGAIGENDNVMVDVENVTGGSGDDAITGSSLVNVLSGGLGNDTLDGSGGDDVLNGNEGADVFLTGVSDDGADVLNGGTGVDVVDYSTRTSSLAITINNIANDGATDENDNVKSDVETVYGGSVGDQISGSSSPNLLEGRGGNDTLRGSGGNDTLRGGDGDDQMFGEAGDDLFDEGALQSGSDAMSGGIGIDAISYAARTASVTVTLDGVADDGGMGEGDNVGADVENVTCGSGDDLVVGSSLANVIVGGAGLDDLSGGDGADVISGGLGADTIDGGDGEDTVDGEGGTDVIDCGDGQGDICADPADCAGAVACEL